MSDLRPDTICMYKIVKFSFLTVKDCHILVTRTVQEGMHDSVEFKERLRKKTTTNNSMYNFAMHVYL